MKLYCVTANSGPSTQIEALFMRYLGSSLDEAEATVGNMSKYPKDSTEFPTQYPELYTILPRGMDFEFVRYYAADGWWVSIVMFTLEEK